MLAAGGLGLEAPAVIMPAGETPRWLHAAGFLAGAAPGGALVLTAAGLLTRRRWAAPAARVYAASHATCVLTYLALLWADAPAAPLLAPGAGAAESAPGAYLRNLLSEPGAGAGAALGVLAWAVLVWRAAESRAFRALAAARDGGRAAPGDREPDERERPAMAGVAGMLCVITGAFQLLAAALCGYAVVLFGMRLPPFVNAIAAVFTVMDSNVLTARETGQAWWAAADTLLHGVFGVALMAAGAKLLALRPDARRFAMLYALSAAAFSLAGLTAGNALNSAFSLLPWPPLTLGAVMSVCASLLPPLVLLGWLTRPGQAGPPHSERDAAPPATHRAPAAGLLAALTGGGLTGLAALSVAAILLLDMWASPFLNAGAAFLELPGARAASGSDVLTWWSLGDALMQGALAAFLLLAGRRLRQGRAGALPLARNYAVFAAVYAPCAFALANAFYFQSGAPRGPLWTGAVASGCVSLLPPLAMVVWLTGRERRWVWTAPGAGEHDEGTAP